MDVSSRLAYSIDEFSKSAGIGRTGVYAEIRAGRLRPVKCGKRTLVPIDEARRWLDRLAATSDAAAR